jgi:catechol 2,3-dioxygenase-like lactoylglutathione lyase family enzyme
MKVLRSHHVSFSVADLAASQHFYGTVPFVKVSVPCG